MCLTAFWEVVSDESFFTDTSASSSDQRPTDPSASRFAVSHGGQRRFLDFRQRSESSKRRRRPDEASSAIEIMRKWNPPSMRKATYDPDFDEDFDDEDDLDEPFDEDQNLARESRRSTARRSRKVSSALGVRGIRREHRVDEDEEGYMNYDEIVEPSADDNDDVDEKKTWERRKRRQSSAAEVDEDLSNVEEKFTKFRVNREMRGKIL